MAKAKAKRKARAPDAIELLKKDHAQVKKAFKQFERAKYKDPNALREFVATICNDLRIHTRLEEEIFYPAVRAKLKDDDLMNEALIEHNSAKTLIADIARLGGDDPMFKPSVTVLASTSAPCARGKREMLPKAKRLKLDLAGLAEQLLALRGSERRVGNRLRRRAAGFRRSPVLENFPGRRSDMTRVARRMPKLPSLRQEARCPFAKLVRSSKGGGQAPTTFFTHAASLAQSLERVLTRG